MSGLELAWLVACAAVVIFSFLGLAAAFDGERELVGMFGTLNVISMIAMGILTFMLMGAV